MRVHKKLQERCILEFHELLIISKVLKMQVPKTPNIPYIEKGIDYVLFDVTLKTN